MTPIYADGGWVFALILTILFGVLAFAAIRKRWPAATKRTLVLVDGTSVDEPKPAKEPEKHAKDGHGSGHSTLFAKVLKALLIILLVLLIIWYIIPFTGWIVDTFLHEVFGDRIVQPTAMTRVQQGVVPVQNDAEQVKIESQSYAIPLDSCGCTMPDWVRIPDGYRLEYWTEGLPAGSQLGGQCSSALEEPPHDASGQEYWCNPSALTGRWWRPYTYEHAESSAVVHYHFRHL